METPSSIRRIARSQVPASNEKSKKEDSVLKPRSGLALHDITNDSPIVGVAAAGGGAGKTPLSSVAKKMSRAKQTPGSGESLLRGQVKTMLQKVEVDKLPSASPASIPAQMPVDILSLSGPKDDVLMIAAESDQEISSEAEVDDCQINRALLFDSPEKSEVSDSSAITYQGRSSEDENSSSAWSLQVNTSIQEEDEEEADGYYDEEEHGEGEDEEWFDDLCDGLMKMSVQEKVKLPEFSGKHTRFVYNSEDEIEGEEEIKEKAVSPNVLVLKGLPAPEGMHLRFPEEEED